MTSRLYTMALLAFATLTANAQNTPKSQMEKLDRGVVAVKVASGSGNFVSWRLLGTDDEATTTFDLMRNQTVIARNIYATNYTDKQGSNSSTYRVVTKVNGEPVDTSLAVKAWGAAYKTIQLSQPAAGKTKAYSATIDKVEYNYPDGQDYTYSPNDMSVGDVDGDGEYELFVKWDPSNSKDNSQDGVTGNVFIDCYKQDGTMLWRIDLGKNIRAGAHYTQFQVYDYDGDGKAELMCKTGPGSKGGNGDYVSEAATDNDIKSVTNNGSDLVTSRGRITSGQEWLTVFNGMTGKAIHTIFYNPNRNMLYGGAANGSVNWGTNGKNDTGSYGNRGERYLATTAYLGGPDQNPSAVFCRGYYTYAFIWAVDFYDQQLHQRWLSSHKTDSGYEVTTFDATGKGSTSSYSAKSATSGSGSKTMFGNGNHNLSTADVDGDGCDEILWGSAALDHNGKLLYATGFGHGDAIHLADHCPDRPGLELFQVHEEKGTYAWDLHDAATGAIIHKGGPEGVDNGRGLAGQFDATVRGSLFWSSSDGSARSAVTGDVVSESHGTTNFRIFWDGDLQEELLDGNKVDKWKSGTGGTSRLATLSGSTCNSTKNTPNLQADILGDWREEVILHNGSDKLYIYSSNIETGYRMPTLMHDHVYRMGITWQNSAYNQPPHLGYYLPDAMTPGFRTQEDTLANAFMNEQFEFTCHLRFIKKCVFKSITDPQGNETKYFPPTEFDYPIFDDVSKTVLISGTPTMEGDYTMSFTITDFNNNESVIMLTIHVSNRSTGIEEINSEMMANSQQTIYDAAGRMMTQQTLKNLPKGLYIIKNGNKSKKVMVE